MNTIRITIALLATTLAAAAAQAAPAASGRTVVCPTAVSAARDQGYRIVDLQTRGLSCTTAHRVAATIAGELVRGQAVSLAGSSSIAVSTTSPCPACAGHAAVSVAVRGGSVTFDVTGKPKQAAPSLGLPQFPLPVPMLPTPQSSPRNAVTI